MRRMYEIEVSGRGPFPVDMLRYDEAFPQSTKDAMAILGTGHVIGIKLVCRRFTPDRWASFGWAAKEVDSWLVDWLRKS